MRRALSRGLLLICLCLLTGARAHPMRPPEAVWAEAQAGHAGYSLSFWAKEGDQHALLLTRDKDSALLMIRESGGGASLVFACERPVYPGSRPFDLRFEGPDSLSWQSNTPAAARAGRMVDNSSQRYVAHRLEAGWAFSAAERLTGMNREGVAHERGLLRLYDQGPDDEAALDRGWAPYEPGPIPMERFDATRFPHSREEAQTACLPYLPGRLIAPDETARDLMISTRTMAEAEGPQGRRVYVSRYDASLGAWQHIVSPPFVPGVRADLFHSYGETLLLRIDGDGHAGFIPWQDGGYRLCSIQAADDMRIYPERIWVHSAPEATWLYGSQPDWRLEGIDYDAIPRSAAQAAALVDGTRWAVVRNPVPTDRLHLRLSPDRSAASLGRYYNGTPVRLVEREGDWWRVSVAGVEGYMMARFLSQGEDMKAVAPQAPEKFDLLDGLPADSLRLYSEPDPSKPYDLVPPSLLAWPDVQFLGIVGDDWYHVQLSDGHSGYVPQSLFWAGNG